MATELGNPPQAPRKRWSGIQLQYGLPTPTTSPKLENEQWAPIEHRVNALAEVQRLQERFAALARSENARVLGTPPMSNGRPQSFEGGSVLDGLSPRNSKTFSRHRKSRSFDSADTYNDNSFHFLKLSDEDFSDRSQLDFNDSHDLSRMSFGATLAEYDNDNDDDDGDDDDEDDAENSILMLRARDLKRAIRKTNQATNSKFKEPKTLTEATTILCLAFKSWCVALLTHGARAERALRLLISMVLALVIAVVLL